MLHKTGRSQTATIVAGFFLLAGIVLLYLNIKGFFAWLDPIPDTFGLIGVIFIIAGSAALFAMSLIGNKIADEYEPLEIACDMS